MSNDPLAFGVDLEDIRARLDGMGGFLSVTDIQDAGEAMSGEFAAIAPAAFVSTASEGARSKNLLQGGGDGNRYAQRIDVRVSALFCVASQRADGLAKDEVEQTRKAVMRILAGWKPKGAESPLEFERYLLRHNGEGLVWGEVIMTTSYRFTG